MDERIARGLGRLLVVVIGLVALPATSAATPSTEPPPELRLKTVAATFPAKATIVQLLQYGESANETPAASGETWMIVKATSGEGTNWGGFAVAGATVSDTAGSNYAAKAASTGSSPAGGEPRFYPQATYALGNSTTMLFLFSIPVSSKGLKFRAGGGELPIRQSPPGAGTASADDGKPEPKATPKPARIVAAADAKCDLGDVKGGETKDCSFKIKNEGDAEKKGVACKGAGFEMDKVDVAGGADVDVKATYTATKRIGTKDKPIKANITCGAVKIPVTGTLRAEEGLSPTALKGSEPTLTEREIMDIGAIYSSILQAKNKLYTLIGSRPLGIFNADGLDITKGGTKLSGKYNKFVTLSILVDAAGDFCPQDKVNEYNSLLEELKNENVMPLIKRIQNDHDRLASKIDAIQKRGITINDPETVYTSYLGLISKKKKGP